MKKKNKKQSFFIGMIHRLIKMDYLKLLEVSMHWLTGFTVKVEFFEKNDKK